MCEFCSNVYHSHEKHDAEVCPIAAALYCSICKIRGHCTLKCTNHTYWASRSPVYIEQLIPYELRAHHKIPLDQMTPIREPNLQPLPCPHKAVLEIPEDKDSKGTIAYTANIRATMASYNLPTSSVKENKKLIESFAVLTGKKVIFLKKDRFKPKNIIEEKKENDKAPTKKLLFKIKKATEPQRPIVH